MNDYSSSDRKYLNIRFNIPEDECELDEEGIECVPKAGYQSKMKGKSVEILHNRRRFE